MRRVIPPKTKRISTLYKDFNYKDLGICLICLLIAAVAVSSTLGWFKWVLVVVAIFSALGLCLQYGHFYRGYEWLGIMRTYVFSKHKYTTEQIKDIFNYVPAENAVELAGTYTAILEICPVEFLLFKQSKQEQIVSQFAAALLEITSGSIIKIERPISYSAYIERYKAAIQALTEEKDKFIASEREKAVRQHKAFDAAKLDLTSFKARIDILEKNIIFLE